MTDSEKPINGLIITAATVTAATRRPNNVQRPPAALVNRSAEQFDALKPKRLVLILDATASRQQTWDESAGILAEGLAGLGKDFVLDIFCTSGGDSLPVGVFRSGTQAAAAMRRIECRAGHTTYSQILPMFETADFIVMIGDTLDGDYPDTLIKSFADKNIPVFAIHEMTYDSGSTPARDVFRTIAKRTGGGFHDLAELKNLRFILQAAGAFAAGAKAVKNLSGPALEVARRLAADSPNLQKLLPPPQNG